MQKTTKSRPIRFRTDWEVRSAIEGTKTQFRVEASPSNSEFGSASRIYFEHAAFDAPHPGTLVDGRPETGQYLHVPCHCQSDGYYGVTSVDCEHCRDMGWDGTRHRLYCKWGVGDRLWLQEAYAIESFGAGVAQIRYRADGKRGHSAGNIDRGFPSRCGNFPASRLPVHGSRATLEITSIRVERLNEISSRDAWNEGHRCSCTHPVEICKGNIDAFADHWQSIHGPGSFDTRWCWVVGVRRV